MSRTSSVLTIKKSIRDELNHRIHDGGYSIDELHEWLRREKGLNISRSAIGRYTKKLKKGFYDSSFREKVIEKQLTDKEI